MTVFRGATAVAGVGYRQYRRGTAPMPPLGLLSAVLADACNDAGIAPSDIDGFVSYGEDSTEPVRLMPELGTREISWSAQVWGGGGGGIAGAFGVAAAAIISGQARIVAIYRALAEEKGGRLSASIMEHHLNDHMLGAGLIAPAQLCALRARRLFERHAVPEALCEELARVSYFHGSRNPDALAFGKPLDIADYRGARSISEPFRLFDCSRENDGAGALLLVSADHARDLRKPAISLLSVAQGARRGWGDLLENDAEHLYASGGFQGLADRLYAGAGLTPDDIDVAQIYENFLAQGIASLIDHGFCTHESAADFIRFDNLVAPGGRLPINTSGGNLAHGFVHGIGLAIEAVRVLRGESANPVPGARTCLLAGGPGAPTVSSAIFAVDP
ncbi:thiolase C-terminal domain-containing protein [Sphingopyxis sp. R3-92]|uniref:thiolase C-terminal domain-containing protein n=1 Tax=Sphingopyxis sp. R3-92 TaxID=3158553 RepID=UPI003EE63069